jgi:DNA-binding transcriptional regulator LsrR (DeoR family)
MIPDDVRRFIVTGVPSVPYLEAVLWLRERATQGHTVEEIAAALYIGERRAQELLSQARAAGIVAGDPENSGAFIYRPAPELAAVVDRLAETYRVDVVGVARIIHDSTQRSAQRFADAFKLRKDR